MKIKLLLSAVALIYCTVSTKAQTLGPSKLVERVEAKPGDAKISYAKYELANGLTLLIHEDNSAPVVHVEVTYKVGSSRELPGRSGFAHFFEHMMFQGSEHVADEEHFKIVQEAGGNMNGTTNRDRTNYFQTVPSNMLETMLWLEADRMGFLPNAFTNEKFEVQRSTVLNEKSQNYDVPYGFISEVKDQLLYPKAHPYSWPIIGFTDDLDKATRDDLNLFFLKYYSPNNAIVVVSGDVVESEVLALTEKYFGSIPKGPEVGKMYAAPFRLPESDFKTYYDDIYFPLTMMVFPTVPTYHADEAPLDLLSELMSGGKNSVFYKNFIKSEKAVDISIAHPTFELSGEFMLTAVSYPFTETKDTRDLLKSSLKEFEEKGFTDEDLARVKESFIKNFYSTLESNAGKASSLTSYEMLKPGQSYNLDKDIERYRKVSKADILRVFNKYIKDKNYACIMVERDPALNQAGAKKAPFKSFNPFASAQPDYGDLKGLTYNRPIDDFDRSVRPAPTKAKIVKVPEFEKSQFNNGAKIIVSPNEKSDRVLVYLTLDGGQLLEDGKKVPYGTAYLTAAMLNESTKKYPAAELEEAIEKLGSTISFSSSGNSINGMVSCYKEKLTETIELLEQMLISPNFETGDFNLLKKRLEESIANQRTNSSIVGNKAFSRVIYGDNPLGKYYTGNYNDFRKIKIDHIVKYYQQALAPQHLKMVVVGNLSIEEAKKSLNFINEMEKKELAIPVFTEFPTYVKNQLFMVNKSYASQSQLMLGYRAMPYDTYEDFFKANIVNFVLGGNFNSRLNLNIREDKGWTYGIYSYFAPGPMNMPGYFMINASVKAEATDSAIVEINNIIQHYYNNGITDEELAFTKSALVLSDALRYETTFGKANFLSTILSRDLDQDYRQKQAAIINGLTKEQVNEYIKKFIQPDAIQLVVVGNYDDLKTKLEALGYGKIQLLDSNAEGKIKINKK